MVGFSLVVFQSKSEMGDYWEYMKEKTSAGSLTDKAVKADLIC